jgi:hypothetical protein
MIQQVRVEVGPGRAVGEEQVGTVLGLNQGPIVVLATQSGLGQQRVDESRPWSGDSSGCATYPGPLR